MASKIAGIINDQTIDRKVSESIVEKNKEREDAWGERSGKLSASKLYWPLQWQVLYTIGVPQKEFDEYVLRKFKRGRDVEDWLITQMPGVTETQKFLEYRDVVGYVDALVNAEEYEFGKGIIPHEIKSVSNAKFRRISDEPDRGHALQGGFYGLAHGSDFFAIDYVSTDDYRIKTYVMSTEKYKKEIDTIIDKYNVAMRKWKEDRELPRFEPNEKWQANPKYNNYPDFVNLNTKQAVDLIKRKHEEVTL